jgi:hypothetical protein
VKSKEQTATAEMRQRDADVGADVRRRGEYAKTANYIHARDEYNVENVDRQLVTDTEELRTLEIYTVDYC